MKNLRKIIFYDPAEPSRARWTLHWLFNLLALALWCTGIGVLSLWFGSAGYERELFSSYFRYTLLFWLNILPVFAVALVFLIAFNRMWCAFLGSGIIVTVLALINYFKLMFRDDPLLLSDARYILEAAKISAGYNIIITPAIVVSFIVIIAVSVLAFFFMTARFRRAVPRIAGGFLLIAFCALAYFGAYTRQEVYDFTGNIGVEFESGFAMNQWNETDQYCCRGFLYPLLHSGEGAAYRKPFGYDREQTAKLISKYGSGNISDERKVNFISVMLESYYDFSEFEDVFPSFEYDPYKFFHELQGESYTGELVTNIFAGGTIDTERCYITGSTQLYDYRGAADSYVRYFAGQGYFTEFCHPGYGWFYNRQNVMEYLGFESSHFFEDRYTLPAEEGIMNDDSFFPDLLTLYAEAKAGGRPYFNFSVSYQNHGPYAADRLYEPNRLYVSGEGLSEGSRNIINNYFSGIRLTDESLRVFFNALRADAAPVVVVLFGDHKPWLGDDATVYAELGIDLSLMDDESFYSYFNTQYLVWANDAAKDILGNDFSGKGGSFSPCFLMTELFGLCGYEGDAAIKSLHELRELGVDVISESGRFRENGELTTAIVSEQARAQLARVLDIQYYRMHDWAKEG